MIPIEQHGEIKYLRTDLKAELYDRLEAYAKSLSTSTGKWNFGIAIERLLDFAEIFDKLAMLEARVDELENVQTDKEVKKPNKTISLLGGHKIEEEE